MHRDECITLWAKVLGVDREKIDPEKNFFDNGGNSIKVLELAKEIYERYNIEIDNMEFFNDPFISNILKQVNRNKEEKTNENLILLRKGKNSEKNIIFIHGGSGEVGVFLNMCNEISLEYNLYAISYNKEEMHIEPRTIKVEDLAETYVNYLEEAGISKIDAMVGWCIGGKIAFEMILMLKNYDIKLYLLNAVPPNQERKKIPVNTFSLEEERAYLEKIVFTYKSDRTKINTTEELWLDFCEYMKKHKLVYKLLRKASPEYLKHILGNNKDVEVFVKYLNLVRSFEEAHYTYNKEVKKIINHIYYVDAVKQSITNHNYWEKFAKEYDELNIKTDHSGMISKEVAHIIFQNLK